MATCWGRCAPSGARFVVTCLALVVALFSAVPLGAGAAPPALQPYADPDKQSMPVPVSESKIVQVDPPMQGKAGAFWFDRLPAGNYLFVVFLQGFGEEARAIAQAKFAVR